MRKNKEKVNWGIYTVCVLLLSMLFLIKINKESILNRTSAEIIPNKLINEINSNESIEQKFISENNTIQSIALSFHKEENDENEIVNISLLKGKDIIQQWNVNSNELIEGYNIFELDDIYKGAKDEEFSILIESVAFKSNKISLYINDEFEGSSLLVGNEEIPNSSMCYKVTYRELNKSRIFVPTCGIILIIFILSYIILSKVNIKIHNIYLFMAITLSTLYFVSLPLLSIPDENGHLFRAYEISEGHMISDKNDDGYGGRVLPTNLYSFNANSAFYDINQVKDVKLDDSETFYGFANISLYSPVSYIPQSTGILIGRMVSNNPILIGYLGRLFNCISIIMITYFAIKFTPIGKKIMLIIALLPMNIHQSISLSPDSMVVALSFALIAFVLYMRYEKQGKMNNLQIVVMYILGVLLSLYKIVYLPFCLLLFLIPKDKFKSNKNYIMHVITMIALVIVLNLGWLAISQSFLVEFQPGVNTAEQIKGILSNPFRYIYVLFCTIIDNGNYYLWTMLGSQMGWLNVSINAVILFIYILLIIIIPLYDEDNRKEDIVLRYFMIAVVAIIALLTFTSIYVQWTAVGATVVSGIQGRYFISLLVPFLLFIRPKNMMINGSESNVKYIYMTAIGINVCVAITLLYKYLI